MSRVQGQLAGQRRRREHKYIGPYQLSEGAREVLTQWHAKRRREEFHFDLGRHGWDGTAIEGVPIVIPGIENLHNRPGRQDAPGDGFEHWRIDQHAQIPVPPLPTQVDFQIYHHPARVPELGFLWEQGQTLRDANPQLPPGVPQGDFCFEPRWAFKGMVQHGMHQFNLGPAWSLFEYTLSDLIVGGHESFGQLLISVQNIVCDIRDIMTDTYYRDHLRCMLFFQGENDHGDGHGMGGKPLFWHTSRALTMGNIVNGNGVGDVLQHLIQWINSEPTTNIQFYRVFVAVLTYIRVPGGGNLEVMPEYLKKVRDGPNFRGRKGYHCIETPDENSDCGMLAVMKGIECVSVRMNKVYRTLKKVAPEICTRFKGFSEKLIRGTESTKKLAIEVMYFMITTIGWVKGTLISPDQLCAIMVAINQKYKLNIGLVILDAIHPHKDIIASYDTARGVKVPDEKICLVHWSFNDGLNGHYDYIHPTNLVTWMQRGVERRRNLVFDYRLLRLVANNESDAKGQICFGCNHYESEIDDDKKWLQHGVCEVKGYGVKCSACGVEFKSEDCFTLHQEASHGLGKAMCELRKNCILCLKIHPVNQDCNMFYCPICKKKVTKEKHVHYIQPSGKKFGRKLEHVVYSDCEGSRKNGFHEAVCIASCWQESCSVHLKLAKKNKCEWCKVAGNRFSLFCESCEDDYSYKKCYDCHVSHTKMFMGTDCMTQYLDWLAEYFGKVTAVFHNGGRYDLHILYLELLKSGRFYVKREAERGTQIIFMTAGLRSEERLKSSVELRFLDSFNFISASLRNFPTMFNISDAKITKGKFPYELLNEDNWQTYSGRCPDYKLFGITELEYKNQDKVSKVRGQEIKSIVDYIKESEEKKEIWVAMDKLLEYTIMDVRVLAEGCNDFRRNFFELSKTDPFHWVTLAAAVAGIFMYKVL